MPYTKQDIIDKVINKSNALRELYKADVINYRGKTKKGLKYSEIVSSYLCTHIKLLESITSVTREKPYRVNTHNGSTQKAETNRIEERIALHMYGYRYDFIGKIVDYQVPLKNSMDDKGLGKIDLLAKQGEVLTILELKKVDSKETLLRAVLEAFTYYKTVDQQKLLMEYQAKHLEKAAFVYKSGEAHSEYLGSSNENVKKLMNLLQVKLYVYSGSEPYIVEMP